MRLPHVFHVRAKGRLYLYFDTGQRKAGGARILARLPDATDPAFGDAYARLKAGRTRRAHVATALTVPALVEAYLASGKQGFAALRPASQALYRIALGRLCEMLPTAPAGELEPSDMRTIMERMEAKPGMANSVLAAARAAWRWGRREKRVANDPTREVDLYPKGEHRPWTNEELEAGLTLPDPIARLAVHVLYYTGQRIGDVVALKRSALAGPVWHLTQRKTGKALAIPLHRALRMELARHDGEWLFSNGRGGPMTAPSLRVRIQRAVPGTVPHGLRKNAVNALLEAHCSTGEVSAITGQSLRMVEHYAKARNQEAMAASAIVKFERRNVR